MIGNAHYQCSCVRYEAISVDSVRPSYGPLAGGTRVTITGQFADASAVKSVFFGTWRCIIDKQRSVYAITIPVIRSKVFKFSFLGVKYISSDLIASLMAD